MIGECRRSGRGPRRPQPHHCTWPLFVTRLRVFRRRVSSAAIVGCDRILEMTCLSLDAWCQRSRGKSMPKACHLRLGSKFKQCSVLLKRLWRVRHFGEKLMHVDQNITMSFEEGGRRKRFEYPLPAQNILDALSPLSPNRPEQRFFSASMLDEGEDELQSDNDSACNSGVDQLLCDDSDNELDSDSGSEVDRLIVHLLLPVQCAVPGPSPRFPPCALLSFPTIFLS